MRLYFHYLSMHLKTCMAHKKSFFLYALGQFLTSFTEFLALWFLLDSKPSAAIQSANARCVSA